MFKKQRQSSKLLELRSFDACKNVCKNITTPMIVMLCHSKIDTEVSDSDMETAKSDDCRDVSEINRDINGILAMT